MDDATIDSLEDGGAAVEFDDESLTAAHEDYIEAIVELEEKGEGKRNEETGEWEIKSADVAALLEVSKASVNKAVQTLRDKGYIVQQRYGRITLTEAGRSYGAQIWARHRALRSFLVDDLGVDEETANMEACEMEHTISQHTMALWVAWLDRLHRAQGSAPASDAE